MSQSRLQFPFFYGWTPLGVWMLSTKDAWGKLVKNAGFNDLKYVYLNGSGIFLVEKPKIQTGI
jgi:hypothetical protein